MKEIRLSIIIPVYNVENYLEICINSIIEEITDEDEIILVEDCSTDSSLEICKKIAECHKHIKIIVHDSNKGLSEARNSGIRYAKGLYITFVDSDDHIASGTYKINIPILENDPTIDILEYPVRVHHLSSSNYIYAPGNNKIETFNEWVIRKGYRHSYAWNKIYKKTLWNGTLFPKGKYLEDIFTIPYIIEKAKKIKKGSVFMMPETSADGCIQLYKAVNFPEKWVKHKELVRVENAVDTDKHFGSASEILFQVNAYTTFSAITVTMIFFYKKLRSGQSKTVNTLFYIADHKQVMNPF